MKNPNYRSELGRRLCEWRRSHNKYLPVGEGAFKHYLKSRKYSAKKAGRTWNLTSDEFRYLTSQKCHYCGKEPNQSYFPRKNCGTGPYKHNGIDRLDNKIGYEPSNCVSCCKYCNVAKLDRTIDEFFAMVLAIYNLHIRYKENANQTNKPV